MDAVALLQQQHEEADALFERFQEDSSGERDEIVRQMITDLRLHATIEEEIFYPTVRAQLDVEDELLEDLEEHHVVTVLLDELEDMSSSDERFAAKVEVLIELVRHHVEEEEEDLFPAVRANLGDDELADLGERLRARADELRFHAEMADATKEELYQRAQQLGIEGRSQMSKSELAQAIERAR